MDEQQKSSLTQSQWSLIILILAVAAGSVTYRLVLFKKLEQTSMLFIGIPLVIAAILAMTPKSKTAMGGILKGITIALLLSGPLLGEGFICILMASPVFYLVGIVMGAVVDADRKRRGATLSCALIVLLPMALEGITPQLSFNRYETVKATRVVDAPADNVQQALSGPPRVGGRLPLYLRLRFPRPTQATGSGLKVGASRTIHFAGGEGRPGDLVMQVDEAHPGYVRFAALSDHSKIAHWLDWRSAEIDWEPVDARHTRVTWTLHFDRSLDPAWYFGPWERYAVRLAAEYLIENNATPFDVRTER
jgi:hypothetical protein